MKRLLCALLLSGAAYAAPNEVTIYLTANLGGSFPLDGHHDENQLLRTAAYLRKARDAKPGAYHFDLGNAFFPGRLSRFSFGSLTADYLQMLRLDAGLVAAGDLNIGADSLDYIRRARGIRLLSANIFRDKDTFFEGYTVIERSGLRIAAVGLTSTRSLVNYAEAKYLDLHLESADSVAEPAISQAAAAKPDLLVVLSGLPMREAVALLGKFPQIDVILCGGDTDTRIGKQPIRMIELPDGRRAIAMPNGASLMRLDLAKRGKVWILSDREVIDVMLGDDPVQLPPTFERRLASWQKGFTAAESSEVKQLTFTPFRLTAQFAAASLRDNYGCDVSFIEESDIDEENYPFVSRTRDIRYAVQNDYDVFTFRMSGTALRELYANQPMLVFSGMTAKMVIGYPLRDDVQYRVCSTQRGFEIAVPAGEARAKHRNQWLGISDSITRTLEDGTTDPDAAADSRFRLLTTLNLSNIYETGSVANKSSIDTPPGQPADAYFKWGLENDVNFTLYNRRHSFSFNPYIFYVRQVDQIVRNLLRADITYTYNTEWLLRPYQKNRVDTVVVPVNGLRPSFLRETVGAEFNWKFFTGRLGGGLEKEILDPVNNPNWGLEANVAALWEFYSGIKYKLGFDSFSSRTYAGFWRHRIEIGNSVIFTVASPITFTVSHRWYYFYLGSVGDFYNSSIVLLSLDLRTTWKEP
jgi:hypothetical protein